MLYLWRTSELLDLHLNILDPAMHLLWGVRLFKLRFSVCGSQHQQLTLCIELFTSCLR